MQINTDTPLILITNDDGIHAKGLQELIAIAKPLGHVCVIAPEASHSGMSHAVTTKIPIRIDNLTNQENLTIYSCSGTPVDSVKIALNKLMLRKPDLILSGINHGSNASISVIYSGTMAAAIEGCLNGIPSIGFSLLDFSKNADFEPAKPYIQKIITQALSNKFPKDTCLNVNIPNVPKEEIKGSLICRQAKGVWVEEFDKRKDPNEKEYFWLAGEFKNYEENAMDTDEWTLKNNYISIVPIHIDLTAYNVMNEIKNWNL